MSCWYLDHLIFKYESEIESKEGDNMPRRYKYPFRRKEDKLEPNSMAEIFVNEQIKVLRDAVNQAFNLKLDTEKLQRKKLKKKAA